jgi:hypothetical protein
MGLGKYSPNDAINGDMGCKNISFVGGTEGFLK